MRDFVVSRKLPLLLPPGPLLLVAVLGLTGVALARSPEPPVVYVAGDGTGDYNCDGTSDQEEINEALDFVASHDEFTTVYLKGPYTFVVDEPIIISSNTILTGDPTATVKLKDNVGWWTRNKPVIGQKDRAGWTPWGTEGDSISHVEIHGFEVSGGDQQMEPSGNEFIPLIHFYYPYDVRIHDMKLHHSRWDVIRMTTPEGDFPIDSKVYDNEIRHSGHEGICFVGVTGFEVYGNRIYRTRTNCGIRAKDCDDFSIHHNVIGNTLARSPSGYAGILIENPHVPLTGPAEVFENVIYGKEGGIHLGAVGSEATYPTGSRRGVHIHHNKLYKIRSGLSSEGEPLDGGIRINGFHDTLIEHNVIEAGEADGIVFEGNLGGGDGYRTIVRNNIILGNQGHGISNKEPERHSFVASYNLVHDNAAGNYFNTTPSDDIDSDPLYAESHGTLNQWHHVVATYDNATETFRIYVDGKEKSSYHYAGFGSIASNDEHLFLGTYRAAGYWFAGREDELGLWNRALTADEVRRLYNDGVPGAFTGSLTDGLQAHLEMENDWNDSSGNGYDAEDATAGFTGDAIGGDYAGLFDGIDDGVQYPDTLSTEHGLSISVWTWRTSTAEEVQTIVNKGREEDNNDIWLFFWKESVEFELGNGNTRYMLEAEIVYPDEMDFHVKSTAGRWNGTEWVTDDVTSPCVDGGDPDSDYSQEPAPNGGRVNIGVYGNTPEASKGGVVPPGEVSPPGSDEPLRFADKVTLVWEPAAASGAEWFNLYRGDLADLSTENVGACLQPGIETNTTTDAEEPAAGAGFDYVVTGENGTGEGPAGSASNGDPRSPSDACP